MHYVIEQFNRIAGVSACRPDVFRRLQRELVSEVQPLLDERDRLFDENAALKAEIQSLRDLAPRLVKRKAEAIAS